MFRAIRDRWGWARGRRLAGLFAFEFIVVVLGVLAAQGLQSWALERERNRHADEERIRLEEGFVRSQHIAKVWRAALPCLRERVKEVMQVAGSDATLQSDKAGRPTLVQNHYPEVTTETARLIIERMGEREAIALMDVQSRFATIYEAAGEMRAEWERFRLLDSEYGQASTADRAAVRAAGASILAGMRSIDVALDQVERQEPLVKSPSAPAFDRDFGVMPVRSCAELWENGIVYRSIEPGEAAPY